MFATVMPLTSDCATCVSCQHSRSVARPSNVYADTPAVDAWWAAQQEASLMDCWCHHDTCIETGYDHDTEQCAQCAEWGLPDEDYTRDGYR